VRRQLAFAARLPNSAEVHDVSERTLAHIPQIDWSSTGFRERYDKGAAEALRYLGTPELVIRIVFAARPVAWAVMRRVRSFIRFFWA